LRRGPAQYAGPALGRRRFLVGAGALTVIAAAMAMVGQILRRRFSADLERATVRLAAPAEPLPDPPTDPATRVAGLSTLFVPNEDFYRIDTALLTPVVTAADWALNIDGMVQRPLRLTYDQLWDRRLVEVDVTLSCVSNEVGGGLVGNARWVGVRLDELLAEAGIDPDADQVMTHSVDGFTAGFPTAAATDGRNAIVALTMNGEVLPVAHGYPARLVVPGLYGYVSATKWLSRIELTRFDRARGYWIPRGWATEAPVKTQSRIHVPRNGDTVVAERAVIAGVAWAPDRGVDRVEVQIDDGPWLEAELGPQLGTSAWRQWWLAWPDQPASLRRSGAHRLRCRASDGTGATQTDQRADPAPDGATGWHTIEVDIAG
jgi:DMSO/TMAO reductase YedYZ molybdopterin-dependent catalytic subunit